LSGIARQNLRHGGKNRGGQAETSEEQRKEAGRKLRSSRCSSARDLEREAPYRNTRPKTRKTSSIKPAPKSTIVVLRRIDLKTVRVGRRRDHAGASVTGYPLHIKDIDTGLGNPRKGKRRSEVVFKAHFLPRMVSKRPFGHQDSHQQVVNLDGKERGERKGSLLHIVP